ncbi:MAG: hypothetical protein AAF202_08695 [Pseudomonadota bacterium]
MRSSQLVLSLKAFVSYVLVCTLAMASFVSPSFANTCPAELSKGQREVLLQAEQGDFAVRALVGEVNGNKKTIVLLGESHKKSPEDIALGDVVTDEFRVRGTEGFNMKTLIGNKATSLALDFAYFLANAMTLGRRSEGSTIETSNKEQLMSQAAEMLRRQIAEGEVSYEEVVKSRYKIGGLFEMDGSELLEMFGITKDSVETEVEQIVDIPLERGFEPTMAGHMTSLMMPALMLALIVGLPATIVDAYYPNDVTSFIKVPAFTIMSFSAIQSWGARIFRSFEDSRLYKAIFFKTAFHGNRDRNMIRNMMVALENHPDDQQMLVIVGRNHLRNMVRLLEGENGFQEIELVPDTEE